MSSSTSTSLCTKSRLARAEKMGNELLRDKGSKDKEEELVLLNRVKEKEAKEILGENKKKIQLRQ